MPLCREWLGRRGGTERRQGVRRLRLRRRTRRTKRRLARRRFGRWPHDRWWRRSLGGGLDRTRCGRRRRLRQRLGHRFRHGGGDATLDVELEERTLGLDAVAERAALADHVPDENA